MNNEVRKAELKVSAQAVYALAGEHECAAFMIAHDLEWLICPLCALWEKVYDFCTLCRGYNVVRPLRISAHSGQAVEELAPWNPNSDPSWDGLEMPDGFEGQYEGW